MTHTLMQVAGSRRLPQQAATAGLLMTATLVPPASAVARSDPKARLDDYLGALAFYLSLPVATVDRILLVDNSAADIAPLVDLARSQPHDKLVEILSFPGNDHPPERGKAYGEFRLMDYGLAHSTLFGPEDVVWKTTGRLKFLNLPAMVERAARRPFDILCDLHNVPGVGSGRWSGHENMDLRVFAFRRRAYDTVLRGLWESYPGNIDAEVLYHRMLEPHGGLKIRHRFPLQARLQGISGRHQRDYAGFSQRSKDALRSMLRQIAPWLWL